MKKEKESFSLMTSGVKNIVKETIYIGKSIKIIYKIIIYKVENLRQKGVYIFDIVLRNIDRKVDTFWKEYTM